MPQNVKKFQLVKKPFRGDGHDILGFLEGLDLGGFLYRESDKEADEDGDVRVFPREDSEPTAYEYVHESCIAPATARSCLYRPRGEIKAIRFMPEDDGNLAKVAEFLIEAHIGFRVNPEGPVVAVAQEPHSTSLPVPVGHWIIVDEGKVESLPNDDFENAYVPLEDWAHSRVRGLD